MVASGEGEKRDTGQVQCPQEAPGTDLCCLSPLGFSCCPVALVADQNYGASVIEAFSVFI